jgi:HEAT repeat protein
VIDWNAYLESICKKYAQWWDSYTITDVVGKNHDKQVRKSLLFDLQAIALNPEPIKPERELLPEAREEREILNVLEGLRKYAAEHVLLIGRPGSGKSTALVRSLLEEAEGFGNTGDKEDKSVIASAAKRNVRSERSQRVAIAADCGKSRIPVLVELRYYETSIIDLITAFLHRHDPNLPIDSDRVKKLLRQGNCLLLIDGVNELPSPEARSHLQKFRQDYQQTTPMIFTTRDLGVGGDLGIDKKLEMQPLTETQMGEFVRGYLPETGEQMLQQLGGRLREFGETPLLLWMLCSVFDSNGNQIPPNLGSVFRRFTEIYDRQIKQDIPVTDESRRWWKRLLQHLAWTMIHGNVPRRGERLFALNPSIPPTEFLVAIPRHQAEEIFTEYLEGKVNCAADCAIKWLDDLLKHHLIQIGAENKIEFRHQLIQEYYAAERLLVEVGKLSDEELQWDYLNYLKWTEPTALMLGLVDDEGLALRVVRLALQVDWQLGARLAGEVRFKWQEKTIDLIIELNLPQLLQIHLLEISKSDAAIPSLIEILENEYHNDDEDYYSFENTILALIGIGSEKSINAFIDFLKYDYEHEEIFICGYGSISLEDIDSLDKILDMFEPSTYKTCINYSNHNTSYLDTNETEDNQTTTSIENKYLLYDENKSKYCYTNDEENINYQVLISKIISDFKHDVSEIRQQAYFILKNVSSRKAINALIEALENKDNRSVTHMVAATLRNLVSEQEIPILMKLLQHHDFLVRLNAVCALGRIGGDSAIPGLIIALQDNSPDVRSDSALAIGNIGSDVAIPELIKLMKKQYAPNLITALEKIQQRRKHYQPKPKFTMSNILSHNYALLIGVGECEEPKLSLPTTVKDIQAVKTLLTDEKLCGYIGSDQHLRLLSNAIATSANILEGLTWLKQQAENDPEATIFIYYSGHGCLDASGDYYLIPHETDRAEITDTALPATKFNAALQQIPAKQLLVIIDSCHAQGMASSKGNGIGVDNVSGANNVSRANNRSPLPKGFTQTALPQNIIDALTKDINKQGTGKVVFTSSTGKQSSWIRPDGKMSVYTYHLLEALQGAANQPGDKVVKVSHLMNHLSKTVPVTAQDLCKAEQTPFFDFATEDFAVALLCGGKGLATEGWDKQQAEETIREISNQVNNGVGIVGDRNIGINIGTAGNITFGDLSSGS